MMKSRAISCLTRARLKVGLLVSTAGFLALPVTAWGQTPPPQSGNTSGAATADEIIITGFKTADMSSALKGNAAIRDIPLTVSGYSQEFIKDVNVTQIADLYNYMVGVQRAGPTGYDISIRGFSSGGADRGSIEIDGLPGLAVRFGSPTTANVAKVEVVKGPASVLYGQVQPGGFVNIITKKPERVAHYSVGARVEGYYGASRSLSDTFGAVLDGDLTGPLNESGSLAYRLIGQYQNRNGFTDNGFGRAYFLAPSVTADLGPDTNLLLQGEYQHTKSQLFDGLVAPNNDISLVAPITTNYQQPGDFQDETGYTGGLTLEHHFSDTITWRTAARAVYHEDLTFGVQNNALANATTLKRQVRDQFNKREYYFADTNLDVKFSALGIENKLLLGANGGRETSDFNRRNFDSGNTTANINLYNPDYSVYVPRAAHPNSWRFTTLDSVAVYVQDQLKLSEQLKAVAAVRWERFDITQKDRHGLTADTKTSGEHVSPMAGIIFQPDKHWSLYASYASSFSPPSPGAQDASGAPINEPQTASQIEGGVKAELMHGKLNATFSVFDIKKKNVIESLGGGISALAGGQRSTGAEIEVDAEPLPNWKVITGYSYIKARVSDDANSALIGLRLANAPVHRASIFTRYDIDSGPLSGVGFSLGVNYSSLRFGTLPTTGSRLLLPAYTVVDAALYYTKDHYSVALQFKNLLDERYYESASNNLRISPGSPGSVSLSVKTNF